MVNAGGVYPESDEARRNRLCKQCLVDGNGGIGFLDNGKVLLCKVQEIEKVRCSRLWNVRYYNPVSTMAESNDCVAQ